MNPYDQPLDWTGYGPTGTGGAPTTREMQQQFRNQHMTTRMAQAAAMNDPVAQAAARRMTGMLIGKAANTDEVRRAMFHSTGGQAAQDVAMRMRTTGMLGQGDPIRAASSIAQGVAAGGFRMSVGGGMGMGTGMQVSGTGAVSEHVSMSFMKKVMNDMYGGTGDTSRMHGFNSQEVSGVFAKLAQRGGIGQVAHLQHGADLRTRLDAARSNAVDPDTKAELDKLNITGGSEAEQAANLQKMADATGNKKVMAEVKALIKAPAALIVNKQEVDRVGQVVKDITESLTGLSDIYGNLSAPELQNKLEQITGMKITNREQAAQASAQVAKLRGAAVAAGMDPRAFMDWSGDTQAQLRGEVAGAIGADGRHSSMVSRITAKMHNGMMVDSAFAAQQANQAVMQGRKLGVDLGDAPAMDEIYEDKKQGRMQFLNSYAGITMAQGGMDNLSGQQRKDAEGLLKQFQSTTDPNKRATIEEQMKALWASAYSGPGQEVDFNAVMASRSGKRMLEKAYSNPEAAREMERMAAEERRDALNINPLIKSLDSAGIADAAGAGNVMLKNLGLSGMGDMLRNSGTGGSAADRLKMQRDTLARAGLRGGDADKYMEQFFDKDGRIKDKKGYAQAMKFLGDADYEPGMSIFDQAGVGAARVAAIGSESMREKMSAKDGKISLNSIATSLATGGMKAGISDPESMVLAMQALGGAGLSIPELRDKDGKMVDATSQYATGIDFSKGLTPEGMRELSRIHGKDLDLHKKMGFESEADLIAATQGEGGANTLADAIERMQTDKDYLGLNLRGTAGSMSAITDSAKDSFLNSGAVSRKMKQAGAAKMIANAMGLDPKYKSSIEDDIAKGKTPDLGMFAAATFDKSKLVKGKDGLGVTLGEGFDRNMKLSGRIGDASAEEMASLAALNEGGEMTGVLEAQLAEVKKARDEGDAKTVSYKNAEGTTVSSPIEATITQLQDAISKLADQKMADGTEAKTIYVKGNIVVDGSVGPPIRD